MWERPWKKGSGKPRWDHETRIWTDIVSEVTLREFSPLSVYLSKIGDGV